MVKEIICKNGEIALCDDEDYPLLSRFIWYMGSEVKNGGGSMTKGLIVEEPKKPQMMQRSELAPCPFCGKQPYWGMGTLTSCQLHGEPMQDLIIYCKNPDCFVKPRMSYGNVHNGGEARTRIEAARKWAYRA